MTSTSVRDTILSALSDGPKPVDSLRYELGVKTGLYDPAIVAVIQCMKRLGVIAERDEEYEMTALGHKNRGAGNEII